MFNYKHFVERADCEGFSKQWQKIANVPVAVPGLEGFMCDCRSHDDSTTWKHFPHLLVICKGNPVPRVDCTRLGCLSSNGLHDLWGFPPFFRGRLQFLKLHSPKHDDVIKWKHFPRYWPFVRGNYRSPVNSPHKDQCRGALIFSYICAWINGWVNNREAGDLRRLRAHYDVIAIGN